MLPRGSAARDIEIAHRTARWAAAHPDRHEAALDLVAAMCGRELLIAPASPAADAPSDATSDRTPIAA